MSGPEPFPQIPISPDVLEYMDERGGDFRISTTCSGPVLMPTRVKPAKSSDIAVRAGGHIIYISRYQIQWIEEITMDLVPHFPFEDDHEF